MEPDNGNNLNIRAIVMISLDTVENHHQGRQTPEERKKAIDDVIQTAQKALPEIDSILKQHGGQRLSEPNALGSVFVETTREGMNMLESLESVTAVMEDQPVSLIL